MNEQTLIVRSLEGDLDAFNQLVLAYQRLAYSVAYRMLHDQDAAADAVQESFIKAYRALESFQSGNFRGWLIRIVTNTCYDVLRAHQRRATESLDAMPVEDEYVVHLIDHGERPDEHAERSELNHLLESAIRALPEEQRLALVLCDVHGYKYEEIAEITGQPMGTVKSRINRARTRVRDYLQQQPELLPSTYRPYSD